MTHQVSSTEKLRVITRRDLPVGTQAVQAALFNFSAYLYNMQIRYTTESFINKASILHNHKYDYSVTQYVNSKSKLKILCSIHGVFEQIPHHHLNGSGCSNCKGNHKSNTEDFILKSKSIHGDNYDYSLVNYLNNKSKIKILCYIHGEFEQIPSHHLNGSGCNKCGNDIKSKEFFLTESINIHGNYYDYSLVNFINTNSKVKIICPIHGEFEQRPIHHYKGAGCQICNESKGERIIRQYLIYNNIEFISQKRFKDCRDKKPLPFDFYLPKFNVCIEYDGEQHFKIKEVWGGIKELENTQKRDKIKTDYCDINNITLIRFNDNNLIKIKEII